MAASSPETTPSSSSKARSCEDENMDVSELLTEDSSSGDAVQKNALAVYCPRCPSLILLPGHGVYVNDVTRALPAATITKKSDAEEDSKSNYQHFWRVDDIFTFENVGFTNTVDGIYKYMTCADCEFGPLGVQNLEDKQNKFSYIALGRVLHK